MARARIALVLVPISMGIVLVIVAAARMWQEARRDLREQDRHVGR